MSNLLHRLAHFLDRSAAPCDPSALDVERLARSIPANLVSYGKQVDRNVLAAFIAGWYDSPDADA